MLTKEQRITEVNNSLNEMNDDEVVFMHSTVKAMVKMRNALAMKKESQFKCSDEFTNEQSTECNAE